MKRIIFKKMVVALVITLLYFNIGIQGMKGNGKCTWDDLKEGDLSAIKLYLFSQSATGFTIHHLEENELSPSEVLQKLQEGLLKIKAEKTQCKYGHSGYTRLPNISGIQCDICSSWCGEHWTFYRCNDCCSKENKKVCPVCFEITKFGPNTREALKNYLHGKTGKEYHDLSILNEFVEYIKKLNWPEGNVLEYYMSIQNGGDFDSHNLKK